MDGDGHLVHLQHQARRAGIGPQDDARPLALRWTGRDRHPLEESTVTARRPSLPTPRALLCSAGTLAIVATTAGCGLAEFATDRVVERYDTRAEADEETELSTRLPDVVPPEATDITIRVLADDPDAKAYDWAGGVVLPPDCVPNRASDVGAPFDGGPLDAGDWPEEVLDGDGQLCGALEVAQRDGHSYAWLVPEA